MKVIRAKVASRAITAGDRLPSIRSFAITMGVSHSTVVEAYDRLVAEGLIRARRGSAYVSTTALPPLALAEDRPHRIAQWTRSGFHANRSMPTRLHSSLAAAGCRPIGCRPTRCAGRCARLRGPRIPCSRDYGVTRGSLALRRILMARFAEDGIEVSADQLLLTASDTQAFDLICRSLLRPGQTVLVDDPCYFNFRALLRAHQVKIVSVPYTASGSRLLRGNSRRRAPTPLRHQFGAA